MILFQCLTLPALGCLMLIELARRFKGLDRGPAGLVRFLIWLAAFIAISWPDLTTRIAQTIGIYNGANLVLYVFVFAFLGSSFYFYSRCARLERQVTLIVRQLAIERAQRGVAVPREEKPEPAG